jgi:hypothetical protein
MSAARKAGVNSPQSAVDGIVVRDSEGRSRQFRGEL